MRWLLLSALVGLPAFAQAEPEAGEQTVSAPVQALTRFLDAAHAGKFEDAAQSLSLEFLPEPARATEGPRYARRLMFLLDQYVTVDLKDSRSQPSGGRAVVGELPLGRLKIPVELTQRQGVWLISGRTVQSIDALYSEHGSPLWDVLPPWLVARSLWVLGRWQWLGLIALLAVGLLLARGVTTLLMPVFKRLTRLTKSGLDDELILGLERPSRLMLFVVLCAVGTRAMAFPYEAQSLVDQVLRSMGVAVAVWGLFVLSEVISNEVLRRARERDEVSSRAVRTQITVMRQVANAVIVVVGAALVLLQFPAVRAIGMSMLASAGVAGVVIGLAAQRSIGNLLAGIQLSFTQPIRIGDTVIVENEWGWIEEITLTYVVVKVWDLRRLVVPIGYFLEKPFQNWTRTTPEILGTVFVYADYRVDVDSVRAELQRILEPHRGTLWNGKTVGLQVTDLTERSVQLRALVSADDAGKAWDLRCVVREGLLAFLRGQHPEALPRVRAEGLQHTELSGPQQSGAVASS